MLKNTQQILQKFAKEVIRQSRANLTRGKKNASRDLYDSLDSDVRVHENSFSLELLMEEYGMFQDLGVKGANPSLVKGGVQKSPLSKFTFRNKMPPLQPILNWVKIRGLRLRDEKGRFKRGTQKSLAHIIQKSIYAQGIKPSLFFTKPFVRQFKKLPDEIIEAFGLDLEEFIKFTTNE